MFHHLEWYRANEFDIELDLTELKGNVRGAMRSTSAVLVPFFIAGCIQEFKAQVSFPVAERPLSLVII